MRISSAERGFSFVEILLALALIALVTGSAVVMLSPARDGAALAAEARDIALWLERGRARALTRRATVELTVLHRGSTVSGSDEKAPRRPVDLQASGPVRIAFHADGSARGGTVPLGVGNRQSAVTIESITGRIRIQEQRDASQGAE